MAPVSRRVRDVKGIRKVLGDIQRLPRDVSEALGDVREMLTGHEEVIGSIR